MVSMEFLKKKSWFFVYIFHANSYRKKLGLDFQVLKEIYIPVSRFANHDHLAKVVIDILLINKYCRNF